MHGDGRLFIMHHLGDYFSLARVFRLAGVGGDARVFHEADLVRGDVVAAARSRFRGSDTTPSTRQLLIAGHDMSDLANDDIDV